MNKIERAVIFLQNLLAYLGGGVIILMMAMVVLDVLLRNLFNIPVYGVYELIQYACMPLVVFPAMAYTYHTGVLPKFDTFSKMGPVSLQRAMAFSVAIIEIVIFALLTYYQWRFAWSGYLDRMGIPIAGSVVTIWPLYFLNPVGFALLWFEILFSRGRMIAEWFSPKQEKAD